MNNSLGGTGTEAMASYLAALSLFLEAQKKTLKGFIIFVVPTEIRGWHTSPNNMSEASRLESI
jgi:hypothetical protein